MSYISIYIYKTKVDTGLLPPHYTGVYTLGFLHNNNQMTLFTLQLV